MATDSQNQLNTSITEETPSPRLAEFSEPRWIAGETMLLLIFILTIYIFVALVNYSWRFRHMARVSGSVQELKERYLHYSCGAVILIALARCVLHQVVVFLPKEGQDLATCRSMFIASRVVYNVAICLTYVHLWLRQHMFYSKKELEPFRSKALKILDWAVLGIIIGTSAVLAFIAFIPISEDETTSYHHDKCNLFEYSTKFFLFLYAGLSLLYQIILLILYIYPVIKLRTEQKPTEGLGNNRRNSQAPTYRGLWRGIRRSFILAVVVIITDAISGVLVWFLTKKYPDILSSIIALNDVNLIVNVICCICTFRNWRKIVFGFSICRRMGWHHDDLMRLGRRNSKRPSGATCEETSVSSDKAIGLSETVDERKILERISF